MFALALALLGGSAVADPIRLATYRYPRYDRAQALAPLGRLIEARLKRPVRIDLYDSPDALRDAVREGRADVAMTNLASYLGLRAASGLSAIAVLDVPNATLDRYRGVLIARRGAGIDVVSALAGREHSIRYAEVLAGSTSGALVQASHLRAAGVDPNRFRARLQSGTHEGALALVAEGRADLAALAEEPWRNAIPTLRAGLVELWRSAPLPPGPVVCRARPSVDCNRLRRFLMDGSVLARQAATGLAAGWSETEGGVSFRGFDLSDYASFRSSP